MEQYPSAKPVAINEVPLAPEKILGTYSGDFKGSPIAITLRYISGSRISGYNIHKGLKRNITGTISLENSQLHLLVSEPGTNSYDGSFDLLIDTGNWKGRGKWMPLKKGEEVRFDFAKHQGAGMGSIYDIFMDSLQNTIELKQDGSCVYNVLQNDSLSTAQQLTIRGNFKLSADSTVLIFWQKNDLIPSLKSTFRLFKVSFEGEEEDGFHLYGLKGEGKEFTQFVE